MRFHLRGLVAALLLALLAAPGAHAGKAARESEAASESDGLIRAAFYNMVRKDLDRTLLLFRRAVARAQELKEFDKELEARLVLTDYLRLTGKPRDAETEVLQAKQRLAENPGEHKIGAAELMAVEAIVHLDLGRYKKARELFEAVEKMVALKADEDESDKIAGSVADQGLAAVALMEDDPAKVKAKAEKGLQEARRRFGVDSMFTVTHLVILSRCASQVDDLKLAMEYLHEAKRASRLAQKFIPLYGAGFGNAVAYGLYDLDLVLEARELNDHCRSQLESWLGPDNLRLVAPNLVGALIAAQEDRLDEAAALGKKAMATLRREFGDDDYRLGSALLIAAWVNARRKDLPKAEAQLLGCRRILTAELGADHSRLAFVVGLLAAVRRCLGKPEAEADLAEAMRIATKHYPATHPAVRRLKELWDDPCPKGVQPVAPADPGFMGAPKAEPSR